MTYSPRSAVRPSLSSSHRAVVSGVHVHTSRCENPTPTLSSVGRRPSWAFRHHMCRSGDPCREHPVVSREPTVCAGRHSPVGRQQPVPPPRRAGWLSRSDWPPDRLWDLRPPWGWGPQGMRPCGLSGTRSLIDRLVVATEPVGPRVVPAAARWRPVPSVHHLPSHHRLTLTFGWRLARVHRTVRRAPTLASTISTVPALRRDAWRSRWRNL